MNEQYSQAILVECFNLVNFFDKRLWKFFTVSRRLQSDCYGDLQQEEILIRRITQKIESWKIHSTTEN